MDLNFGLPGAIEVNEPNIMTLHNTKINTLCYPGKINLYLKNYRYKSLDTKNMKQNKI